MPNSAAPTPPVDPVTPSPAATKSTSTDLPSNVAAALACIPLIGGIIFYVLEKRDAFVRFYAMQSIIFGGAWIIFSIAYQILHGVFNSIPGLRYLLLLVLGLAWAVITIAFLVIFIITIIKAFSGVIWEIPYLGPIARKQVDGTPIG
ncbi:MAG: hypothetical protein M3R10_01720 [Verrucomicrobiota bacterium]|nr:hypothetical protein [Verrucomicrobiota bacterium]